jgi:hypothetical protein
MSVWTSDTVAFALYRLTQTCFDKCIEKRYGDNFLRVYLEITIAKSPE